MGLRGRGAAGLRRVPLRSAGLVAGVVALYLGAGLVSTWPALKHADDSFMAEGLHGLPGAAGPGHHLPPIWELWLPGPSPPPAALRAPGPPGAPPPRGGRTDLRPVQLPAGGGAPRELRGLAVQHPVLAAPRAARDGSLVGLVPPPRVSLG